jgi:hypothetical protein
MHKTGFTLYGDRIWTAEELVKLRELHGTMTLTELAKRLGRSYSGVRAKGQELRLSKKRHVWTGAEIHKLRKIYTQGSRREIAEAFPDVNIVHLTKIANNHRIYKKQRPFKSTGIPVLDEVRRRAFELGYSMVDLDAIAGTGKHFQKAYWHPSPNYRAIAKAVIAMDGQLTAVWNDPEEIAMKLRA